VVKTVLVPVAVMFVTSAVHAGRFVEVSIP
jgi:hypothetical protein